MYLRILMLAAAAATVPGAPALAQDDQGRPPAANCQAVPAPDANRANEVMPEGGVDAAHTGSLSPDKLTHCDGVLKPPATGDEMAQPPPEAGAMREIRPGELPGLQSTPRQE